MLNLSLVIVWLLMGWVGAARFFANTQEKFPALQWKCRHYDRAFAIFQIMTGPVGLLVTLCTDGFGPCNFRFTVSRDAALAAWTARYRFLPFEE